MKKYSIFTTALACAAGVFLAAVPLRAAILVSDNFTHANGSFISSGTTTTYAPSTSMLGVNYSLTGGGGGDGRFFSNTAQMHNGGGVGLAMGTYNDSDVLTLSADISFDNVTAPIQTSGYALLGFYTAASTGQYQSGLAKFTGLRLNLDGSIQLYLQGTASGSAVAYGGTYAPATAGNLTFTISTVTGAISGISFGSSSANYTGITTTGFTVARTEFVGIGGSLNNSANWITFDNFTVTNAVPEPSTYALILGGLVLLVMVRRARKTAA